MVKLNVPSETHRFCITRACTCGYPKAIMSLIPLWPHLQMTQLVWMSGSKDRLYHYHGNVDMYSTQYIHNTNVSK